MPPCRVERRHFAMTIGKKLYAGFGLILAILSMLFIVNIIAGFKERSARADASMALESVRTVEAVRTALIQVESTEASWSDNFAKPLIAKRHQVDSGDATVSDLQIFYLQKDPSSW